MKHSDLRIHEVGCIIRNLEEGCIKLFCIGNLSCPLGKIVKTCKIEKSKFMVK
jgi:hypothetical protein